MELHIVTHYNIDDTEFSGGYYRIELFDENGTKITEFGDHYHDKGEEKVEGFIQGVEFALQEKINVIRKDIADEDY